MKQLPHQQQIHKSKTSLSSLGAIQTLTNKENK